jgi:hypothetical protein
VNKAEITRVDKKHDRKHTEMAKRVGKVEENIRTIQVSGSTRERKCKRVKGENY